MKRKDLQAWRKKHGYSQSQLARALGIKTGTVSKWEQDINPIPSFLPLALKGLEQIIKPKIKIISDKELKQTIKPKIKTISERG